jgi:hypothetical protein
VSTASRQGQREDKSRAELHADGRQDLQRSVEREVSQESSVRASEVASNTGAVQTSSEAPHSEREPPEAAVAGLTQVGIVEAERADAIVTRFFQGNRPEDSGPEPRPEEKLGERSVPLSTFA